MSDTLFGNIPAIVVNDDVANFPSNGRYSSELQSLSDEEIFNDWPGAFSGEEINKELKKPDDDIFYNGINAKEDGEQDDKQTETIEPNITEILCGDLPTSFQRKQNKIKLFVCSSGDDTGVERQRIMASVVPRLHAFARARKMSFEIVDFHPFGNENKHYEDEDPRLSIKQIQDNQTRNSNPAYLMFVSHTLGSNTKPPKTLSAERMFGMIHYLEEKITSIESQLASSKNLQEEKDKEFRILNNSLQQWREQMRLLKENYKLDKNLIPQVFIYNRIKIECNGEIATKKEERRIFKERIKLASTICKLHRILYPDEMPLMSLMDAWKNIECCISSSEDPRKTCFWFRRNIIGIKDRLDDGQIGKLIHVAPGTLKLKTEEEDLTKMAIDYLEEELGFSNTKEYNLSWKSALQLLKGQTALIHGTKTSYLEKLCFDVYYAITQMIERQFENNNQQQLTDLDKEIVEHLSFATQLHESSLPRTTHLSHIRSFINTKEHHYLFVTGHHGSGKSTLLSSAVLLAKTWMDESSTADDKPIVIFRSKFLSGESNVCHILSSICNQIKQIILHHSNGSSLHESCPLKSKSTTEQVLERLDEYLGSFDHTVESVFKQLLVDCGQLFQRNLLIFLDNFDIGSSLQDFLPASLPSNVKVIISFQHTPQHEEVELRRNCDYFHGSSVFNLTPISKEPQVTNVSNGRVSRRSLTVTCDTLIKFEMKNHGRNLASEELEVLNHTVNHCPYPLVIKLCTEIAKDWTSHTNSSDILKVMPVTGYSVKSFAQHFLELVESKFDYNVTIESLYFIAISNNGLCHHEIIDLLCRHKTVTDHFKRENKSSVFPEVNGNGHKHPKKCYLTPHISAIWYSVFDRIKVTLIENTSDDILTLKLRHQVYDEIIRERLQTDKDKHKKLLEIIAAYFNDEAFACSYCDMKHKSLQPLVWKEDDHDLVLNKRRLSESLTLALACGQIDKIKKEMLFNFEWLYSKVRGYYLKDVMSDIRTVAQVGPRDKDLQILSSTIFLSRRALRQDFRQFTSQLIGRLYNIVKSDKPSTIYDPRMYPLIRKLYLEARKNKHESLIPSVGCMKTSHRILYDAINGHRNNITALTSTTDGKKMITASLEGDIKVWDVLSRNVTHTITNVGTGVSKLATCMGNFYIVSMDAQCTISVWNIRHGTSELTIHRSNDIDDVTFTISREGQLLVVFSRMKGNMTVWDLDRIRKYKEIDLMKYNYSANWMLSVSDRARGNNVFYGFIDRTEAMIVNVKRGKYLQKLICENGFITKVTSSREYYIIACTSRNMHVHEIQCFNLYDVINYGYIKTIKACPDDKILDVFVNMLGSHLIALCKNNEEKRKTDLVVWGVDQGDHQHIVEMDDGSSMGTCIDLQYCVVASTSESSPSIYNLAAKINSETHSRTHVKARTDGVRELFPISVDDKFVVARGFDNGPISIWDVSKGNNKGESIIIERGLLEKSDIVVVKDYVMVVLSDRTLSSGNDALQVFETLYVYNLLQKRYERKLTGVCIHPCPVHEYMVLGGDQLLAPSFDRRSFVLWSLHTGKIISTISHDFNIYETIEQDQEKLSMASLRKKKAMKSVISASIKSNSKWKTTWKPCHVSSSERTMKVHDMVIGGGDRVLICSYFSRHLAVFDLEKRSHVHTLTDKESPMYLNQCSKISESGKIFVHTNHNTDTRKAYITLWCLETGSIMRRLCNEPQVGALAVTANGDRVIYVTSNGALKVWDPFRRHSLRSISSPNNHHTKADFDSKVTKIYILNDGEKVVIISDVISLWDVNKLAPISKFTPDSKIFCSTLALHDVFLVFGMKGCSDIITLKLQHNENLPNEYSSSEEEDE